MTSPSAIGAGWFPLLNLIFFACTDVLTFIVKEEDKHTRFDAISIEAVARLRLSLTQIEVEMAKLGRGDGVVDMGSVAPDSEHGIHVGEQGEEL